MCNLKVDLDYIYRDIYRYVDIWIYVYICYTYIHRNTHTYETLIVLKNY